MRPLQETGAKPLRDTWMSALLLSSQTSSSFEPVANLVGGRNVSVEPRFPGTPGGTLQPSRMAQLLPVEYPYGGAVGSEDWEPNSPSGALDPCAMSSAPDGEFGSKSS